MARILVVEDCPEQTALLGASLSTDHEIVAVADAAAARDELRGELPDLVLLDIGLPGLDGFGFAAELRQASATQALPIIFLSSRTSSADKVLGFTIGAQDYVEKPFDAAELRARISARLGESQTRHAQLRHGDLHLDTERMCLSRSGDSCVEIELTATEFRIVRFLIGHPRRVVSRSQLIEAAWNGRIVSERTIDTHMWALRRKLDGSTCRLETVRGFGYRLAG